MVSPEETDANCNDEERERIRQAAIELNASHGLSGTTIRNVAERAKVSEGTIYRYFSDRAELLRSLWAEPVAEVGRRLEQIANERTDPVDRLRALLGEYVNFVRSNPGIHRHALLFVRPASHPSPTQAPLDELPLYRFVVEALEALEADGRLAVANPRDTAELLWAAMHGALGLAINSDVYAVSPAAVLAPRMLDYLMGSVIRST